MVNSAIDSAQQPEIDPTLYARLTTEGAAAWRTVREVWGRDFSVAGKSSEDGTYEGLAAPLHRSFEFHVCCRGANRLVTRVRTDSLDGATERRDAINSTYSFTVIRDKSSEPNYVLSGAALASSSVAASEFVDGDGHYLQLVDAGCRVWGDLTLDEMVSGSSYQLTGLGYVSDAPGTIRLEAEYSGADAKRRGRHVWAEVQPDIGWRVVRAGIDDSDSSVLVAINYHDAAFETVHFPKQILFQSTEANGGNEIVYDLAFPSTSACSDAEFLLAHYGIPESAIDSLAPPRSRRFAFVIAGFVALLLAFCCYQWAGRLASKPESG